MSAFILLRVSTPNRELAQAIAIRLVTERLAASVHVTGPIDTRYWWQGEIHHDMEWSCEARTHQSLKEQAVEAIVALHPFEVPEIFFHELRPATSEYEAWLKQYATGEKTTMMTKETPTLSLSPVIMGTWQVDRSYWTGVDDNGILRAVHAAFDVGVTTFDTAEEYGDGYSEQLLGKALGDRRQEAQILTKVSSDHLRHEQVVEACHRSLANLNTDYLDLYQIHWPGGSWGSKPTPIDETMEALLRLKEEGKIRAIGVSNFSLSQLQEVATYGEIFSLQPPYSLFWRHIDRDIRPYCEANGIRILAYSPLAQGLLTGKFKENHSFEEGDNRRDAILFQPSQAARVQTALADLRPIAERLGLSLGQLAISWVINQPLTHAITGVRNADQIIHNGSASSVSLRHEDLALMEEIGRKVSEPLIDKSIPWTWTP